MTPELKKKLTIGGVSAAILLGVFAAGRYTVPTKTVTVDHTVQVWDVTKVSTLQAQVSTLKTQLDTAHTEIDSLHQQISTLKLHQHQVTHTVTHPDGTVDQTQTTDTHVDTTVSTTDQGHTDSQSQHQGTDQTSSTTSQTNTETGHGSTTTTHEQIVTNEKPQWHLNVGAGFDVGSLSLKNGLSTGPLVFNGSAEHHVIGPFSFGPQVIYDRHLIFGVVIGVDL
jgi:hypothetical protein